MVRNSLILLCVFVVFISVAECCQTCGGNGMNDKLIYKVLQTKCTQVTSDRTNKCEWHRYGMAAHTDVELLGGKIAAYKIRWFSGGWSNWFVPGVNDMDCKFNKETNLNCGNMKEPCGNSVRRWWSYFFDHQHTYILCKDF